MKELIYEYHIFDIDEKVEKSLILTSPIVLSKVTKTLIKVSRKVD